MNDALLVRGFQRLGNLAGDRHRFVERDRPLSDAIRKRRSLDQLQHECLDAVGVLQPVDRRDVGMIQGRQDFRLALEAGQPLRISGDRGRAAP